MQALSNPPSTFLRLIENLPEVNLWAAEGVAGWCSTNPADSVRAAGLQTLEIASKTGVHAFSVEVVDNEIVFS